MTKVEPTDTRAEDQRGRDEDERTMRGALAAIASGECWSDDDADDCHCPAHQARWALKQASDWRYRGALAHRQDDGLHPSETRMMQALRKYFEGGDPDLRLAQVLHETTFPTRRDWHVVASVVQWLATNIGSTVLEAAGYRYTLIDQDRAARDKLLPPTLLPRETGTP